MKESIFIREIDERSSFLRDEQYPQLIFLSTVLRWAVTGNVIIQPDRDCDSERIIKNNNKALASVAALLADKIENEEIPILNAHTKLPIGIAEKNPILARLRSMDGASNVDGLIDGDGQDYYLGGRELYMVFVQSVTNVSDDQKGSVWHRLAFDAPTEWHDVKPSLIATESSILPTTPIEGAEPRKVEGLIKRRIMHAFDGLVFDYDHWGKNLASPPKWLIPCRVAKGSKKASSTWNPVSIGFALMDKGVELKRLDLVFMGLKDWKDEWQEKTELMR